jgi:hypothetical protein
LADISKALVKFCCGHNMFKFLSINLSVYVILKARMIRENYSKLGEADTFDLEFWQSQTPEALFQAAFGLVKDYLLMREGYANEPRLKRTVESFQKA